MGSALTKNHSMTSRANTPGTASRGSWPRVAAPMTGRRVRWASSIPVPAAAGPPSSTPSTSGNSNAAPPRRLTSTKIPPATPQAVSKMPVWRPASRITASRCAVLGSWPAAYHRTVGARLNAPATATPTIPSTTSTATMAVSFAPNTTLVAAEVWPRSGIRMAATSMTAMT